MVERIIQKAVQSLAAAKADVDREAWLKNAEKAEQAGYPLV